MTIQDVINLNDGFNFIEQDQTNFPAKIAFAIIHNKHLCELIVKDYEATVAQLIQKYPHEELEENGKIVFQIQKDSREQVAKELNELAATNVEIQLIKIKLSDIENLNLSLQTMDILYNMIEEG